MLEFVNFKVDISHKSKISQRRLVINLTRSKRLLFDFGVFPRSAKVYQNTSELQKRVFHGFSASYTLLKRSVFEAFLSIFLEISDNLTYPSVENVFTNFNSLCFKNCSFDFEALPRSAKVYQNTSELQKTRFPWISMSCTLLKGSAFEAFWSIFSKFLTIWHLHRLRMQSLNFHWYCFKKLQKSFLLAKYSSSKSTKNVFFGLLRCFGTLSPSEGVL